ncbi:hypothetical protein [Sorangium sp. So ce693]|uniref:hypothetical protein n=1 Tax=Sorangium sp. So ce693 TaxID=3133318 RepID=UPI003F629E98
MTLWASANCSLNRTRLAERRSHGAFGSLVPPWARNPRSANRVLRSEARQVTDLCEVWNPEDHEIPELAQMKRYDAWCFARKLAPPWDLVNIEALPMLMSWAPGLAPGSAARPKGEHFSPAEQTPSWTGEALIRLIMSIRQVVEARLNVEGPPSVGSDDITSDASRR